MNAPPQRHRALIVIASLAVAACSPAYLLQAARGQARLLRERQPVEALLGDTRTPATLRAGIAGAAATIDFARTELALPDNGSYRHYVDVGRPYVVWNVVVAPALSLELRRWCFPIAGCVAYRGYFEETAAGAFAAREARRGHDVVVGGVRAYSTLGILRDPLLSTMLDAGSTALPALIFHELAHQRLYVGGDTVFSESFATLVEQEGMRRWLQAQGDVAALCRWHRRLEREAQVHALLRDTRVRLAALYASAATTPQKQAAKATELQRLEARYQALRAGWPQPPWFDGWFAEPWNNARLGALAAYRDQVGQLRVMLESEGGDLRAFYRRAERLARLDRADRAAVLAEITGPVALPVVAACRDGPG